MTRVATESTRCNLQVKEGTARLRVQTLNLSAFALVAAAVVPVFSNTLSEGVWATISLFLAAGFFGLRAVAGLSSRLGDGRILYLGLAWVVKLALGLILVYLGWAPQLDATRSDAWGYDPQRYYVQAGTLPEANWMPDIFNLNYVGILYYYGAVFWLLGQNPAIPALLNALTTLVADLLVVRIGYAVEPSPRMRSWWLGLGMLLPEIMWFDVMTSRETIMMALLTISSVAWGSYWFNLDVCRSFVKTATITAFCGIAVASIRMSMLLPLVVVWLLLALGGHDHKARWPKRSRPTKWILAVIIVAGLLLVAPRMNTILGGYDVDYSALYASVKSSDRWAGQDVNWSNKSIGWMLLPSNLAEAVTYAIPRLLLYLVAPLPRIAFDLDGLAAGSWESWQTLMMSLSSLVNLALFPMAVSSLVYVVSMKERKGLIFHIPYWTVIFSIALGAQIIHERYRVMASLLLWACAWLGVNQCPRRLLVETCFLWAIMMGLGVAVYLWVKAF